VLPASGIDLLLNWREGGLRAAGEELPPRLRRICRVPWKVSRLSPRPEHQLDHESFIGGKVRIEGRKDRSRDDPGPINSESELARAQPQPNRTPYPHSGAVVSDQAMECEARQQISKGALRPAHMIDWGRQEVTGSVAFGARFEDERRGGAIRREA
jgi:hypothetical protein